MYIYIPSQQSQPTQETMKKWNQLMEYTATYPNSYIRFHAIDMILILYTYAAYLVMPKVRSLIEGCYYLRNKSNSKPHLGLNGDIIIECKTLKHVVESASETDTGWGDS